MLHPYHPFRDELVEQNGVIFVRLIVPPTMRHSMIELLHSYHAGVQATLRRARDVFYVLRARDVLKSVLPAVVSALCINQRLRKNP